MAQRIHVLIFEQGSIFAGSLTDSFGKRRHQGSLNPGEPSDIAVVYEGEFIPDKRVTIALAHDHAGSRRSDMSENTATFRDPPKLQQVASTRGVGDLNTAGAGLNESGTHLHPQLLPLFEKF